MGGRAWGAWPRKSAPASRPICPLCRVTGPRKRGDKDVPGPHILPGLSVPLHPPLDTAEDRPEDRLPPPSLRDRRPPAPDGARRHRPPGAPDPRRCRALEARRSATAVRKRKNKTDLASTQVHVQRLREENRRPNARSTYSKCWRLWKVSASSSPPLGQRR